MYSVLSVLGHPSSSLFDDFHELFNIPPKSPFIHPFYMLRSLKIKMLSWSSLIKGNSKRLAEPIIKLREMPYQLCLFIAC